MSEIKIDILEKELERLKDANPEKFNSLIEKFTAKERNLPDLKKVLERPIGPLFSNPPFSDLFINDIPDNITIIERVYNNALYKITSQNEIPFFDIDFKTKKTEDFVAFVDDKTFEIIRKMFFVPNIDSDNKINVNIRLKRDNSVILGAAPFVKARKIINHIISNSDSDYKYLNEFINNEVMKNEFKKKGKELLIRAIQKKMASYNKIDLISHLAAHIKNTSSRFYDSFSTGNRNFDMSDIVFVFPISSYITKLLESNDIFGYRIGSYDLNETYEWSSDQQIDFVVWVISFLISNKLYEIAEKKGSEEI